jgi:translation initiation factor 1 (eIF-1/SUI1)
MVSGKWTDKLIEMRDPRPETRDARRATNSPNSKLVIRYQISVSDKSTQKNHQTQNIHIMRSESSIRHEKTVVKNFELELEKEDVEQNVTSLQSISPTLIIKPLIDLGMLPIFFMLYVFGIITNWATHLPFLNSNDNDFLRDTKQIQCSTENEIDQVAKDQKKLQDDMNELQDRLRKIEQRRKTREESASQNE